MDAIKEMTDTILYIPISLWGDLTPLGRWTIWLPFAIIVIIAMILFFTLVLLTQLFNIVTNNYFPNIWGNIRKLFIR